MKLKFFPVSFAVAVAVIIIMTVGCTREDSAVKPAVTTSGALEVGRGWAMVNGKINANNLTCLTAFDYDTDTTYRYSITGIPSSVDGNTNTSISAEITGLGPGTKYYFRLKAIAGTDTTYGSKQSFTTTNPGTSIISFNPGLTYGSVKDIDGNSYKTIKIGTQTWMAENLKTTKFNDGTAIPFVLSGSQWTDLTTPGYCWYNNDSLIYGALYNWYAVSEGNLCPAGWHVPSDQEWSILTTFLGDETTIAGKLREAGTVHWLSSPLVAANESGFTALPGGYRSSYGIYSSIKRYGYFWSSTENLSLDAFCRNIQYSFSYINKTSTGKQNGLSVRCIKD